MKKFTKAQWDEIDLLKSEIDREYAKMSAANEVVAKGRKIINAKRDRIAQIKRGDK